MNIADYIKRALPNMGIGTYGDLLNNNGDKINLESLTPEEKDNYNKLKLVDKTKLLQEHNKDTNYIVSPMLRKGQQQNIGGIVGTFQQVM